MSTISEDLEQIKYDEDNIAANKVARFCYTEQAYQNDDYEGVPEFDPNVEQNIPLANADTLKTNATILDRGFRSQASSLPRMLVNHFFGRVSYNLNKAHDNFIALIETIKNFIGQPNGIASLDGNGRIPYSQLPESAIEYQGNWDASTNTPELSDDMAGATSGDFYIVKVGGTVDFGHGEISFLPNDRIIYNKENQWERLKSGNVQSVNNKEPETEDGNVMLYAEDINFRDGLSIVEKIKYTLAGTMIGKEWKQLSNLPFSEVLYAFTANNRFFVSSNNGLYVSLDGKTWTQTNIPTTSSKLVQDLIYGNNLYLCGFESKGVYTSLDGITWNQSGLNTVQVSSIATDEVMYNAATNNGIYYSEDGVNWVQSNAPTTIEQSKATYSKVCYINDVWLATGTYNLYKSIDGKQWNQVSGITRYTHLEPFTNVGEVLLANFTTSQSIAGTYISTDKGTTWTKTNLPTTGYFSFSYGKNTYIAVTLTEPSTSSHNYGIYYSQDGLTWTKSNITSGKGQATNASAFGSGLGVAMLSNGVYYTQDAKTWTKSNVTSITLGNVLFTNYTWLVTDLTKFYLSSAKDIVDGWSD